MKLLTLSFALLSYLCTMAQHTIVLKSGKKVDGVVLSLNNDVWNVYTDGKEQQIQMKDVSSIFFKEYVPYDGVYTPDAEERVITADGFTVKYQIKGRTIERPPKVSIGSEDKGAVVVKITVDRYGNVKSAEPGASGSTTSNNYLYVKAKTAAKSAKFSEDLKGPLLTEGTITIVY